ncbi:MAG: ABC-F family ATP-binding cassette domain-containing protein [Geminicoccaceae bacterium]|nr:ABC-F family ATP-binding cassette domain-containing protein [Geminicoccaceae bacterium]
MLHINDLTLRIAGRPLLEGANLHVAMGQRVGFVGRNGTGKTSLLRLIEGRLQADQGALRLRPAARLGAVAQDAPGGGRSPLEAVLAADRERQGLLDELAREPAPERIAEIETRLLEIRADAAPARAARILKGLGFDDEAQGRPLSTFSGGWRMRVALASVLFVEPDLLLLDEPTNHLDLEATMWLEQHLRTYPRTLFMVSHDRELLNSVPDRIVHLEGGKLKAYAGGYDSFERIRSERMMLEEKAREKQEAARRHIQSFIDRFRYKASKARQAQSRIKMLERMRPAGELISEPEIRFDFGGSAVPAPPLMSLERIDVGYDGRPVLRRLDLRLDPEDRIALLGANGNGKSTLAKLLAGSLSPISGEITRARNLEVGYFAQHQIELLDADRTPIEHLRDFLPQLTEERLRARLGRFGLVQHKAETVAGNLSGGERTRLSFALMCVRDPQILILDEPSNHLDIDSREALVEAINAFPGAVVLISHDRRLVEFTADALWLVRDGRVRTFEGDMEDYRRELLASRGDPSPKKDTGANTSPARMSSADRRAKLAPLRARARDAEREVEKLQGTKAKLDAKLADPNTYLDGTDIAGLNRKAAALEEEIGRAEALWLDAEAEIEALELG